MVPLLAAVVVTGAAALGSVAVGLPLALVLAVTAAVALVGAFVAQRTVLSVLAGLTLLVVRPYAPGERVRLPSPEDGSAIEAEVVRLGLANTTLATTSGLLIVPNSRLLPGVPQQPDADINC
jgi:small-conductance mechanosensitive channel